MSSQRAQSETRQRHVRFEEPIRRNPCSSRYLRTIGPPSPCAEPLSTAAVLSTGSQLSAEAFDSAHYRTRKVHHSSYCISCKARVKLKDAWKALEQACVEAEQVAETELEIAREQWVETEREFAKIDKQSHDWWLNMQRDHFRELLRLHELQSDIRKKLSGIERRLAEASGLV